MTFYDDVNREAVHDWLDCREPDPDRPTRAEAEADRRADIVRSARSHREYVDHIVAADFVGGLDIIDNDDIPF